MKKFVYILLFVSTGILAQTTTENYIKTTRYTTATTDGTYDAISGATLTNDQKQETITYFDGLGRPKQNIGIRAGGQHQDLITHIGYDDFGRQAKDYLPFATASNGGLLRTDSLENQTNQYYLNLYPEDFAGVSLPDVNAYSEKVFDNSPLNRVLEQAAPGKDWKVGNNHTIKFEYGTNTHNEVLKFGVGFIDDDDTAEPTLQIAESHYAASTLYKNITKDENWRTWNAKNKTTEEYKNKQGQVVLKRTYNQQQAHDTYYVYDDFGNLTYVLPPLANEKTAFYETGLTSYPASTFVTGGDATGSVTLGIEQTAPGNFRYVVDIDLHNLENSDFKTGEILDLPNVPYSMGSTWLGSTSAWNEEDGSYAYKSVSFYTNMGKLMCYAYTYNRENIPLVLSDFENTTYSDLPQNLQGFTEVETQEKVDELLNNLCYQYKYDHRNRLIEKKIPGKGWESIVYDRLDRPVLTQDNNLKAETNWLFTKYDILGRVIYTGMYTSISDRDTLQTSFNSISAAQHYETNQANADSLGMYYSNDNFPNTDLEVFTVNYYDNYADLPEDFIPPTSVYNQPVTTNTKSLPTVSKVRVLETTDWITTLTYYDEKARPIYVYTKNEYLNTIDIVESKLDFTGKVLETTTTHKKTGATDLITVDKFDYDHAERLITHKQTINSQDEELLVKNSYDALGQLIQKEVGATEASPLQDIDYAYNIRGWLKKINDPITGLGDKLFSMQLLYNDPGENLYNSKLYNGNISQTIWSTASDNVSRYYNYYYDDLNRITSANYYSWQQYSRFNLGSISYDKNGNLQRLYRQGAIVDNPEVLEASHYGTMDNLSYTYQGNQLIKVTDTGNDAYGFKDGVDLDIEYTYDANGNLTSDDNKGVTSISYNHLNLPTVVAFSNQQATISYVYDATGTKLRKTVAGYGISSTNTDYAGNYIYENNTLQFFNTAEGYATPNSSGEFDYIYQYKDHLGNVRLSYTENLDIDIPETVFYDNATNTQGWDSNGPSDGGSAEVATDKSYSGGKSFKIHRTTGTSHYAHSNERVAIDNDQETAYTFSGRIFVESEGYAWGKIILFMDDETGSEIITETASGDKIKTKGEWVYFEKTVMVPANIDKINLRIGLYHQTNNATAWFDDLKIVKGNLSRTTIVEESNYYPFGLKHKGYNNVVIGTENNHKTFNGKELNESLGLNWHDYGARRYDASLGRWMSKDPLAEKYETISPYTYVSNNPVNAIDPDGRLIIYVNGLLAKQYAGWKFFNRSGGEFVGHYAYPPPRNFQRNGITMFGQSVPYWGGDKGTRGIINNHFDDNNNLFINATDVNGSQASDRFAQGQASGLELIERFRNGEILKNNEETIKVVGHSQGAAFAAGIIDALANSEYASRVELGLYLSSHQPDGFEHNSKVPGAQLSTRSDWVSSKGSPFYENSDASRLFKGLMNAFNGQSKLSEIKGVDFLFIRPNHDDGLGGHSVDTWNDILQRISDFLKDDDDK